MPVTLCNSGACLGRYMRILCFIPIVVVRVVNVLGVLVVLCSVDMIGVPVWFIYQCVSWLSVDFCTSALEVSILCRRIVIDCLLRNNVVWGWEKWCVGSWENGVF